MKGIGPTEILVILGIVVLLFGGKKLPELARGSGKALRIFKTEVKALDDDEDSDDPSNDKDKDKDENDSTPQIEATSDVKRVEKPEQA